MNEHLTYKKLRIEKILANIGQVLGYLALFIFATLLIVLILLSLTNLF